MGARGINDRHSYRINDIWMFALKNITFAWAGAHNTYRIDAIPFFLRRASINFYVYPDFINSYAEFREFIFNS